MFDPIVKPSMRESWENQWEQWFVTTNETKDIRKPGKLKGWFTNCEKCLNFTHLSKMFILVEFSFEKGRFIALSPKTYFAYDETNKTTKSGLKGVMRSEAARLGLESFAESLYESSIIKVTARELRRNNKMQMTYAETEKVAMNNIFKKFRVQDDRISCLPLCKNGKIL